MQGVLEHVLAAKIATHPDKEVKVHSNIAVKTRQHCYEDGDAYQHLPVVITPHTY